MKLSDYVFSQLREWGAPHVFLVTGDGAIHLNDSVGTRGPGYVCNGPGPALFDISLDPAQEFEPRLRSRILPDGKILTPNREDMYPFLSPEELESNMLVRDTK